MDHTHTHFPIFFTSFSYTYFPVVDPGLRTPDSLNAESGALDPGLRTPDSLNAESGPGGASPGLGVTLSATIQYRGIPQIYGGRECHFFVRLLTPIPAPK